MGHFVELLRSVCVYVLDPQIVLSVLLAALLLAIGSGVFASQVMSQTDTLSALVVNGNSVYTGFLVYWSYIILLSPAMPIALYISLVPSTIQYCGNIPVFVCVLCYCLCVLHVSAGLR